ncbi:phosphatase PAP2 family protein [Sphaerotilus mobilis]|uniref:PAP2 superfamily protein n=1 Tax=Sphaerotilus mobilis TaxID=47994 RepID=A0A4Q7LD43_9BURK|nr:phosphatase PAP2 family protein [Sphaerotilus mobilis]RZS51902.1 PAP2 superfamily protein [Sphaerotilus mobilis]
MPDGFYPALWRCWRRHLWVKVFGISGFMWLFFIGYFHLLRHPAYPVTVMPLTWLDQAIPLQPGWLAAYVSLWVYVGISPGLFLTLRRLIAYGVWAAAMCLTGLACFYFWPNAVPPHGVDVSGHAGFALLQGVDAAGNACPSLHVASAAYSGLWLRRQLTVLGSPRVWHVVNLAWFLAIAYSTLATKQHVALDAVAGTLLGGLFALAALRWGPRAEGGPQDIPAGGR